MRIPALTLLAALAVAGPVLAQDAPPPGGAMRGGPMLPSTRAEASAQVRERFARLDQNGDGVLAGDELPSGARGGRGGRQLERYDGDHDGKLSATEFEQGALALFDRMDSDRDGTISPAERDAWRAQMRAGRPPEAR